MLPHAWLRDFKYHDFCITFSLTYIPNEAYLLWFSGKSLGENCSNSCPSLEAKATIKHVESLINKTEKLLSFVPNESFSWAGLESALQAGDAIYYFIIFSFLQNYARVMVSHKLLLLIF